MAKVFRCPRCGEETYLRKIFTNQKFTLWSVPIIFENEQGYGVLTKKRVDIYFRNLKQKKANKK
jgi:hypothetical protein